MRRFLSFLLTFVFLCTISAFSADTVVEEIVARINNQIVTRTDYLRTQQQLKEEAQQQDPTHADKLFAERQRDVLRDLIDQQLLLEKGKDLGITADTDLIKKLDQMRKEMNLDSMDDLEKAAVAQGVSFEDFKQNLRNQIITEQVIGREVESHVPITKEEEEKFYEEHKSEMQRPEGVRLSEILISIQPKTDVKTDKDKAASAPAADANDPQLIEAAKAKAEDLLGQIKKGAAFDDVAKKNSNGPTAAQGGDLGYFKRGDLAKELEDKTFALEAGGVTDVIRTRQGFVILKVTDHPHGGIPSFKEAEPHVQDALYREKLQPALRAYLTKLREDAYIDIKPGYTDSGASPNETKPVETDAKAPTGKKLKKKKKFLVI